MILFVFIVLSLVIFVNVFMRQAKFGMPPAGERLNLINQSSHHKEGKFQNLSYTPDLKEGVSYYTVMKDFFFGKSKRNKPGSVLPSQKTDLKTLDPAKNVMVWFGHSSYFLQVDGKKILVDPVLSGSASPVNFTTRAFKGSDVYTTDDIPGIDYLFISHDHWDHLDYETIMKLKSKIRKVITGLGTAAHFEHWGFNSNIIIERDWDEEVMLDPGFVVNTTAARHFSGRSFKRNQAVWMSFVLTTPTKKMYLGGDSGYDTHFKNIGEKFGPFDLAILECGQYNEYWKYIHMMPEEVVQASLDLKAKKFIPVHWAKFSLSLHAWDEPITRVTEEAKKRNVTAITPMIGEEVNLNSEGVVYREWWKDVL
jgi:L-ascorbate metabolism protein UlaG (beta-lactamase superfamily)